MSGDPPQFYSYYPWGQWPIPMGRGGYQTWNTGPVVSEWVIRKCISCSKDFPVRPVEGAPFPEQCNHCTPAKGGTGS